LKEGWDREGGDGVERHVGFFRCQIGFGFVGALKRER